MALHKLQRSWFNHAIGRTPNPDHVAGLQCVDPPKDYSEHIFPGVSWQTSIGAGNAKDMFWGASTRYFEKFRNDPSRPNMVPKRGDVIVWAGTSGPPNPYGHIAIVWSANASGVTVYQMDGFLQVPIFKDRLGYRNAGTGMVTGWLRPRKSMMPSVQPVDSGVKPINLLSYQRVVGSKANVAYRKQPSTNGKLIQWLKADHKYDFKGYVHGEPVGRGDKTNDVWFVGKYTGGYAWSGAFTDASTKGLKDLTPEELKPTEAYQRVVGKIATNYRKGPSTAYGLMRPPGLDDGMLNPDTIYDFDAWTHGQPVTDTDTGQENDVWFRGRYSHGWAWSGAFKDQSTDGLKFIKTEDQAGPGEESAPPVPEYTFEAELACVTRVSPARVGHFQADGMPDKVLKVIDHQFGDPAKHGPGSIVGVLAWFASEENEGLTSSHFAVEEDEIAQCVMLKDRAYHGGAAGNDFYGVEIHPDMSPATIASVRRLLTDLFEHEGRVLVQIRHNTVSNTYCGTDVDLSDFADIIIGEVVEEAPEPEPEPPNTTEPSEVDRFLDWFRGINLKNMYEGSKS